MGSCPPEHHGLMSTLTPSLDCCERETGHTHKHTTQITNDYLKNHPPHLTPSLLCCQKETEFEAANEYLSSAAAHTSYFDNADVAAFLLRHVLATDERIAPTVVHRRVSM